MESNPLKVTIKLRNENVAGSLMTDDLNDAQVEPSSEDGQDRQARHVSDDQDRVENGSEEGLKNDDVEDEENRTPNSQNQLVCYDPTANGAGEPSLSSRQHSLSNRTSKIFPSIGAFTVQCANCFKWRLIPTMEKYEEIREFIIDKPFFCETGREWQPGLSCNDPPDITQDGSRLWAIDKPNIPRPPSGWKRLLRIRGEGGTKFADVYYTTPSGKRLRSLLEVQRFLNDNLGYAEEGINMSRFSFQIPRPLQENYVRKRAPQLLPHDFSAPGTSGSPQPAKVLPLAWMPPDLDTEMQLGRLGLSYGYNDSPFFKAEHSKRRKTLLKPKFVPEHNEADLDTPFRL